MLGFFFQFTSLLLFVSTKHLIKKTMEKDVKKPAWVSQPFPMRKVATSATKRSRRAMAGSTCAPTQVPPTRSLRFAADTAKALKAERGAFKAAIDFCLSQLTPSWRGQRVAPSVPSWREDTLPNLFGCS